MLNDPRVIHSCLASVLNVYPGSRSAWIRIQFQSWIRIRIHLKSRITRHRYRATGITEAGKFSLIVSAHFSCYSMKKGTGTGTDIKFFKGRFFARKAPSLPTKSKLTSLIKAIVL
jgi:hypothetical protein